MTDEQNTTKQPRRVWVIVKHYGYEGYAAPEKTCFEDEALANKIADMLRAEGYASDAKVFELEVWGD